MDFLKALIAVLLGFCVTKITSLSASVSENGNFTISSATNDWKTSCNGRKPAEVNVHWDTLSLDGDLSIPDNGSRVWIGYYRQYQYFSVKGCASAGPGGTHIGNVDNPLGHCFFLCKHLNHIALAGAVCHCLSDDAFNSLPINNATCSYETCWNGLVCGNNNTMWIYEVAKKNFSWNSIAPSNVKQRCLSLTKSSVATWNTDECSQVYRVLCMQKDGTFDRNESAVVRGATWDDALKICHDKGETLANISLQNYRSVILSQQISDFQTGWTSFVRDMVVGTGGFNGTLIDLADCAVIYKSDGKTKIDYQDCSNSLPAVCLIVATRDQSTSTTPNNSSKTTTIQIITTTSRSTSQETIPITKREVTKTTLPLIYESTSLTSVSTETTVLITLETNIAITHSFQTARMYVMITYFACFLLCILTLNICT